MQSSRAVYYNIYGVILGLYWGYMGIMEQKMEASILGYRGYFQGQSERSMFSVHFGLGTVAFPMLAVAIS